MREIMETSDTSKIIFMYTNLILMPGLDIFYVRYQLIVYFYLAFV